MSGADEIVVIVDAGNNVAGSATRARMRAEGLWHRSTYVLVLNSAGQVWVQKRTMTKDIYPGWFDPVAGGVVLAGESYEESAARELAEEMGIEGVELKALFDFRFEEGRSRVWGRAFVCEWDGAVRPQPEEVASVHLMTAAEILGGEGPFTPDGLLVARRYFDRKASDRLE
jgi:8-oxo-dGTP pyrophosphatase MutT (NUDIX family)